ncbi:MAG: LysM peptidoglycan-binding domain-containing protein [Chitinophagales bacterium]|nr:LysM peptidoglycan-binding domain-containing protein [Chitinophagales bacterium]MDW8419999.1 LysM peptidoglycan-binding domain-containing protein [Chitinophagales bacterium]
MKGRFLTLLAVVAFFYGQYARAQEYITHTVEWSETIYSIPVRYGITTKEFLAINGFTHDVVLKPGMVVRIREMTQEEIFAKKRASNKNVAIKVDPVSGETVPSERQKVMIETRLKVEEPLPVKPTSAPAPAKAVAASSQAKPTTPAPQPKLPEPSVAKQPATHPDISIGSNGVVYKISKNGYHLVEKQQTAYHISKIYNISIEDLLRINNLDSTNIKIGQVLKVRL